MLFNQTEEQRQEMTAQDDGVLGVSFAFDWKAGHCEMAAGSPVEISGTRAAQAWLQQVLRTKRERYSIYPTDFGAPAQTLVGQKYPKGFLLSELRRQLAESAAYCPAIQDVGDLKQEGDAITGTVSLTTRSGERQEVFHFGP